MTFSVYVAPFYMYLGSTRFRGMFFRVIQEQKKNNQEQSFQSVREVL